MMTIRFMCLVHRISAQLMVERLGNGSPELMAIIMDSDAASARSSKSKSKKKRSKSPEQAILSASQSNHSPSSSSAGKQPKSHRRANANRDLSPSSPVPRRLNPKIPLGAGGVPISTSNHNKSNANISPVGPNKAQSQNRDLASALSPLPFARNKSGGTSDYDEPKRPISDIPQYCGGRLF